MFKHTLIIFTVIIVIILSGCKEDKLYASLNPSLDTIEVGTNWSDPGCSSTAGSCIKVEGAVITDTIGLYEIIYEATDGDKSILLKRIVTVVDTIAPIASLNPGIDTIKLNGTWNDAGCTGIDIYDGDVDCITLSNNVDVTELGEYVVYYKVTDSSGNEMVIERYVFVVE